MRTQILLLALLITSCGSSDPKALTDSGSAALNSGDAAKAVSDVEVTFVRGAPQQAERGRSGQRLIVASSPAFPAARSVLACEPNAGPDRARGGDIKPVAVFQINVRVYVTLPFPDSDPFVRYK
jgi:hypothetical protein